ncbi:hypothetical protein AGMMS50262_14860 [Bacteroidia bacterium]|nr:hypothetical protein AGMMS50262_14860 [Bacteroidia bacterium]
MKIKIFLFSILLGLVYLTACDQDSIDNIGSSIQPDGDKIGVYETTIDITGKTVKVDSVYAKSINGLLGKFYDPEYGEIEAGYICQYYPDTFYLDKMKNKNSVDSVRLLVLYRSYVGDSLSPMEVTVYPVKQNMILDKNYYSNINPANYCDLNNILGRKTYTARNLNISDSLNTVSNTNQSYKVLSIPLPVELGNLFLEEYKKPDHGALTDPDKAAVLFPGTYLASTFGSGCILDVEGTRIHIYYDIEIENSTGTADTTVVMYSSLNVTKEVIQLNHLVSSKDETLWQDETTPDMYIKTPAGVFSQISIPLKQIKDSIGDRWFSKVSLKLTAQPRSTRPYSLDFPGLGTYSTSQMASSKLLLIEPDSVKSFFEQQRVADNQTSYFTTFNASDYTYSFENISNVVQNAINNTDKESLDLLLIPTLVSYYTASSGYTTSTVDNKSISYLTPSAVTLKRDDLKIQIIAVDLGVGKN